MHGSRKILGLPQSSYHLVIDTPDVVSWLDSGWIDLDVAMVWEREGGNGGLGETSLVADYECGTRPCLTYGLARTAAPWPR